MATVLYPVNSSIGVPTYNKFASLGRGTSSTTIASTTTTGDVLIGYWCSKPLHAFTLSSSISVNLWGDEQNSTTNAGFKCIVYKLSGGSLSGALATITTGELGTTAGTVTGSATPTSTSFLDKDQIVLAFYVTPAGGTIAAGRTVNFYYSGPTAAAQGDSYVTFTDNFVLRNRTRVTS